MDQPFDYFVIFAGMRTGSNFLEANINAFPGLSCYGEAFNPGFVCYPDGKERFGMTLSLREKDPLQLIREMRRNTTGLAGFRFFQDHDPRVLAHCLADVRCAKIILTRNPLESYVSWKIAQATGQWKLTDAKHKKSAKVTFDANEFITRLQMAEAFEKELQQGLQVTGQTAFHIDYEDIGDVRVINGLARFLGQTDKLKTVSGAVKKQNPNALSDKVENPQEMQQALAGLDFFGLSRLPSFEPKRGPFVPSYIATVNAPLIYLPIEIGMTTALQAWLSALDGTSAESLSTQFNQKMLRQWKRRHPGHRSFTVVRHPVARAHAVFCNKILGAGPGTFPKIRDTLRRIYKLKIPANMGADSYDCRQHRRVFLEFLSFLKSNLAGQTSIRVDAAWASQTEILQGFSQFSLPDMVLRAEQLQSGLVQLADQVAREAPPLPEEEELPYRLADIYDEEVEAAVRDVYQRDYMMFGYKAWDKAMMKGR